MNKYIIFKTEASKIPSISKDYTCDGITKYPIVTLNDIEDDNFEDTFLIVIGSFLFPGSYAIRDNNGRIKTLLPVLEGDIFNVINDEILLDKGGKQHE